MEPFVTDSDAVFRAPGELTDSDHPAVVARADQLVGPPGDRPDDAEVARRLFRFVRDLRYEGGPFEDLATYRASSVLAAGHGYCVGKASLFVALARAAGLAARVAFADVRNHLASPRLLAEMRTDTFAWHGYGELLLGRRWVAASPTFDRDTCRRAGVAPLEFDGVHDALLQAFGGGRTMDYVRHHGSFHDVPGRFLAREMPRLYPHVRIGPAGSDQG
jgi:transglutaminase-like putative cysteine protease